MNDPDREELLSAYLDGELSADEQARVEHWLSESSELRQKHEELLALRAAMQALPRHTLQRDLASSVLKQTVPQSNNATSESGYSAKSPTPTIEPARRDTAGVGGTLARWWDSGSNTRRLLWPAIAVAAALIILIYDANQRPGEQQVARVAAPESENELADDLSAEESADKQSLEISDSASNENSIGQAASSAQFDASPLPPAAPGEHRSETEPSNSILFQAPSAQMAETPMQRREDPFRSASPAGGSPTSTQRLSKSGKSEMPPASPSMSKAAPFQADRSVAPGPKADAQPAFLCTVTQEYLNSNAFEKLLTTKSIAWEKISSEVKDSPPQAAAKKGSPPEVRRTEYLLHADSQRVDEVLKLLPQTTPIYESQQPVPRLTAPQIARSRQSAPGVKIILVSPEASSSPRFPSEGAVPSK